jgi:transcription initiation factor TFIIA large subunit
MHRVKADVLTAMQGNVYQQIIEKVIQASQNDFEEFGVDQSTLDEMKQVCHSSLAVCISSCVFPIITALPLLLSLRQHEYCGFHRLLRFSIVFAVLRTVQCCRLTWGGWAAESGAELPVGLASWGRPQYLDHLLYPPCAAQCPAKPSPSLPNKA